MPLHGCGDWTCTTEANHGVSVRVLDLRTETTIGAMPFGTLHDGSRVDTMFWDQGRLHGGDRPGIYSVEVQADGYETWTRSEVAVAKHPCHGVENTTITARLRPAVPPSARGKVDAGSERLGVGSVGTGGTDGRIPVERRQDVPSRRVDVLQLLAQPMRLDKRTPR